MLFLSPIILIAGNRPLFKKIIRDQNRNIAAEGMIF
jgi:hypothetical protein